LSAKSSKRLRETISKAFDKEDISIDNIINSINDSFEATKGDLRVIVRTEVGQIANSSRKAQLDKTGVEYEYKHIGPKFGDGRTTVTSKNIMDQTKNFVSWDKYLNIVKTESKKEFPLWEVNPTSALSHYQSRHTFSFRRKQ